MEPTSDNHSPTPLAELLRPQRLEDIVGQTELVGESGPLRKLLESGQLTSMVLWGPPGSGKTTLARLVAAYTHLPFVSLAAVETGVAEIRKLLQSATERFKSEGKATVLFMDEIHRLNKSQQDIFLPFLETGAVYLIGATTENPGFYVNSALLSRSRVFRLQGLNRDDLLSLWVRVRKFLSLPVQSGKVVDFLIDTANADARSFLSNVEYLYKLYGTHKWKLEDVSASLQRSYYHDKKGDSHYDVISALIKSMRGSDADASLHYLARLIQGGEDPLFIARRLVIFASEDIGNARPNALVLAVACQQAVDFLGMPESGLVLSQTVTYLATCPKSIASTVGLMEALDDVRTQPLGEVPLHLRNAANSVMKAENYGKGHVRYPWLEERKTGKQVDQKYLPDVLRGKKYYRADW